MADLFDELDVFDEVSASGGDVFDQVEEPSTMQKVGNVANDVAGAIRGPFEAGAALLTGVVGAAAGGLSGLGTVIATGGDYEAAKAVEEGVANQFQFKPVTPLGKDITNRISPIVSSLGEIGKEAVELPLESWNAPGIVRYPAEKAAEFGAYGVVKPTMKGIRNVKDYITELSKEKVAEKPVEPIKPQEAITEIPVENAEAKIIPAESIKLDEITPEAQQITELGAETAKKEIKPIEGDTTGIKNEITTAEREARGLSEVEREVIKEVPSYEEGKRLVDSGERDPSVLAKSIVDNPRPLMPEEVGILTYDRMRIKNEIKSTMDSIEKAMDSGDTVAEAEGRVKLASLEERFDINDKAARHSGTLASASLRLRRMMVKEDYSLAAMIQKAKVENGLKELPAEMRAKYETLSKQIEEASAKLKAHEERLADLESNKTIEKIKVDIAREQRQTKRVYAKEELAAEFDGLVKELNQKLGGQLSAGIDPTAALIIGKMAKNRVRSGVITVEGVVDHIYTEVKKMGIELDKRTIRDAISGYGVTKQMSKEAIDVQMRELRSQMRLISAFEDASSGKAPLRSGLQRDVPSDTVRELGRKVQQAMRENGIDIAKARTPEEQWKSSLDAVKTRLSNQIHDITKQLITGEKTPKKVGIQYDAAANVLKELRDGLKGILEQVEGKPKLSDEQKVKMATAAVEKSIKEYERRIAEKDLTPQKRVSTTPVTPELKALRETRDALKKTYQDMQKEARPQRTPEEIALQSFKTRTTNKIAELEQKLATGDFAKKERKEIPFDKEGLDLKFRLDKAVKSYNEARFQDQLARRSTAQKIGGAAMEAVNLSRALKTSFDVSAVLRQGGFIAFAHPIRAAKSIPDMFRALASEKGQFKVEQEILSRPQHRLYEQAKLFLSEHGNKLSDMEEVYMSRLSNKIPGVAASQRAYTTFLNKLRADSFDAMLKGLSKDGKPTPKELNAIANYINVATGRGTTAGKSTSIANALVGLNTVFFAPRYVLSRFQLLAGQPLYGGTAATRMMIAKEYGRFLIGAGVVYSLALSAGGEVETDPRSSDFSKIKFGNTRIDPMLGLAQTSTLVSREISGATKSAKGKIVPIREWGVYGVDKPKVPYGSPNAADVMGRFLRSKLSPVVGATVDVAAGKDVVGNKVTMESMPEKMFAPLAFNDIYETMKEQGVPAGSALAILSLFGMGLQNYDAKHKNPDTIFDTIRQDFLGEQPESTGRGVRSTRRRARY